MDNYTIRWNAFSEHIRDILSEMMISNYLTDVTLVCDDKQRINAHKLVLSACSNVFKSFLDDLADGTNSVIYLRGIQYKEMKMIVEFMYTGITQIENGGMGNLFDVAKNLEVTEMCKNIEIIMKDSTYENIAVEDLEEILLESEQMDIETKFSCDDFMNREEKFVCSEVEENKETEEIEKKNNEFEQPND